MNQRGFWQLDDVSNERLVAGLAGLLTTDGRTEARIVAYLAELDARRLHLRRAQSLFDYCQRHLGLSENQVSHANPSGDLAVVVERGLDLLIAKLKQKRLGETSRARSGQTPHPRSGQTPCAPGIAPGTSAEEARNEKWRPTETRGAPVGSTPNAQPLSARSQGGALDQPDRPPSSATTPATPCDLDPPMSSATTPATTSDLDRSDRSKSSATTAAKLGDLDRSDRSRFEAPTPAAERLSSSFDLDRSRSTQTPAATPDHLDQSRPRVSAPVTPNASGRPRSSNCLSRSHEPEADQVRRKIARAHISHETRRHLTARDGFCCSYVGDDGKRCGSRAFLQAHHQQAWATGGADTLDNLRWLCGAHNRWIAERELGTTG